MMMIMMTTMTMTTSLLCVEHVLWPLGIGFAGIHTQMVWAQSLC